VWDVHPKCWPRGGQNLRVLLLTKVMDLDHQGGRPGLINPSAQCVLIATFVPPKVVSESDIVYITSTVYSYNLEKSRMLLVSSYNFSYTGGHWFKSGPAAQPS
jgi:hypothetical protein